MAWFINQSLFIILAAFLLGLLVGWLVWGERKSSLPPSSETSVSRSGKVQRIDVAVTPTAHTESRRAKLATVACVGQDAGSAVKGDGTRATERRTVTKPATTAEPTGTRGDELERIEGIGPKMAAALRAAGIHTFRQLAEADDDTRRTAIEAAGLTFAPSLVTWGRQARLLADGDEAGFAELTELLVAGRDTGRS